MADRAHSLPRRLGVSPIWLYVLALALAGAGCWIAFVHGEPGLSGPHLPWWTVALGFVCGEICVVHLQFRRSAHSFSLGDLPFIFGLAFAGGDGLMLGALVGTGLVWRFYRRLPPVKLAFNLAQLSLSASVSVIVLHAVAGPGPALGPSTWIGLYAAMLSSCALTVVCIAGAIAMTEGGVKPRMLRQMLATGGVVALTNSSIAISAAVVVSTDARAVPMLVVPALTLFAAYRAYISERERHEKLEILYEASRTLSRSPEVAEALDGLLVRSLEAFRSEIAEVLLVGADGTTLRTAHGPGTARVAMEVADPEVAAELAALVSPDVPAVSLTPPFGSLRLRLYFQERGIRHAMVGILPGEERSMGTLLLANRFGLAREYGPEDLRLLEALANNASVALQHDRLEQAVTKLETLQDQLHHRAFHDPLTDLPNRALFMERLREELGRDDDRVAVLFVDVDDFKTVNDTLGHAVGDALLVAVAERLRECVRPQDTVARLGGDEFAVMLPRVSDPTAQGRKIAARILEAFALPIPAGAELVSVRLSIGVADNRRGGDGDELILNADVAMYQAKAKGKARFEHYEPSMRDGMLRRQGIQEELAMALGREQMVVEYQPIVTLDTGRIVAAEALVRWDHPVRGLVPPSEFVAVAERTGVIIALGRFVLGEACRQARRWQDAETDPEASPLRMHVNLSAVELRDSELVDSVRRALAEAGLAPAQLVLEVSENQLVAADDASLARLAQLRSLGVRIALDDFGTGSSSLSRLQALPLDVLKIACEPVQGLDGSDRAGFVGMAGDLARSLNLEVIAEGIETPTQLSGLRSLGIELGQGFFLGRPSPPVQGAFRSSTAA
jgi:diguanylate cyclase (GGDEF)-like protein